MKKSIIAISVWLSMTACCSIGHQEADGLQRAEPESMGMDSRKLERIDSVVSKSIADGNIPGAVVSVVREDKIVFLKAYGYKSVVPDTVAMTPETVFDLASCSKVVGTTLSFMQLVERGQVRLTDPVKMYIPDFAPYVDPVTGEKTDIRVRDLLTHSSGLPPYADVNHVASLYGEPCPDSLMRYIATATRRNFPPGTDFTYSCLNFVTLQNILQNITGQPLEDYAQRNVFDALGLKHTCYNAWRHPDILPLVAPTEVQPDGLPLVGKVHDPIAWRLNAGNSGNAGVFSNAEDLSVVAAALMNGGAVRGRRILGSETVKMMCTVPSENAPHIGRALGWDIWSDYSWFKGDIFSRTRTINHTGYTGTSLVIDLDSKTAVIVLAHRVHPADDGSMARTRATLSNIVAGSIY